MIKVKKVLAGLLVFGVLSGMTAMADSGAKLASSRGTKNYEVSEYERGFVQEGDKLVRVRCIKKGDILQSSPSYKSEETIFEEEFTGSYVMDNSFYLEKTIPAEYDIDYTNCNVTNCVKMPPYEEYTVIREYSHYLSCFSLHDYVSYKDILEDTLDSLKVNHFGNQVTMIIPKGTVFVNTDSEPASKKSYIGYFEKREYQVLIDIVKLEDGRQESGSIGAERCWDYKNMKTFMAKMYIPEPTMKYSYTVPASSGSVILPQDK